MCIGFKRCSFKDLIENINFDILLNQDMICICYNASHHAYNNMMQNLFMRNIIKIIFIEKRMVVKRMRNS